MELNFADLQTDPFPDNTVPSFPEGELDRFLEEPKTNISHGRLPVLTEEDEALDQEEIGQTRTLCAGDSPEMYDITLTAEDTNSSEEGTDATQDQARATGTENSDRMSVTEPPVEHHWPLILNDDDAHKIEEDGIDSGKDEEEDTGAESFCSPGDWSVVLHSVETFCDRGDMGRPVGESQPLALEGTEHPHVRNEEQGEFQSDLTYFGRVSAHGNVKTTGDVYDGLERVVKQRDEEESSDSDLGGSTGSSIKYQRGVEQEVNMQSQYVPLDEGDDGDCRAAECLDLAMLNMDGLVVDGFAEQPVEEKMKDFSGDDHQEAGESFADYPSDFSSCEFVEEGKKKREVDQVCEPSGDLSDNVFLESEPMEGKENTDEEGDQGWTGMEEAVKGEVMGKKTKQTDGGEKAGNVRGDVGRCLGEGGEGLATSLYRQSADGSMRQTFEDSLEDESDSSSYDSSGYEDQERTDEELPEGLVHQGPQRDRINEGLLLFRQRRDNISKHSVENQLLSGAGYVTPTIAVLTSYQCPTEAQPAGQLETGFHTDRSPATHGTVDDSFMFDDDEYKAWEITEEEDDQEEERERNWEQEQKRIQAFYRFYNDKEEENATEKEKKKRVHFCMDPLSQIFQYDADSSSEGEDLSSAENCKEETEPETWERNPTFLNLNSQPAEREPESSTTLRNHHNKDRCLSVFKFTLKMGLVTLMGMTMFCWATDLLDWLG